MDSFEKRILSIRILKLALKSEFDLTPNMVSLKLDISAMSAQGLLLELTCNGGFFKFKQKNAGWVRYFEPNREKIMQALADEAKLLEIRYSE